jgi:outer membrane usher protein
VDYTAFLSGDYGSSHPGIQIDGGSLSLDGNVFGRFGTFSQSAIASTTFKNARVLRLDTSWSYSDPETVMSYRAGDLITGGLAWTRPLRIGGVQIQRNFSIRPDLITLPLPTLSGSAAVPSTLDVYLGNVKTYSTEIPSGPYQIENLPVISGAGTARVVVTDTTGRQIESESTFFTDARLLRKGLVDFSVEAGVPRLDYGLRSAIYDDHPVITASGRIGLTDQVTLQGHAELGNGLHLLGGGLTFAATPFGLVSGAVSLSQYGAKTGMLFYGAWDLPAGAFNLHASTQRTTGDYRDLASLIGGPLAGPVFPRAIDQFVVSYQLPPDSRSSLSIGAIHSDQGSSGKAMILNGSFNRSFENGMSVFVTGFRDLHDRKSFGAFAGLTVPLDASANGSVGVTSNNLGEAVTGDLVQSIGTEPGSVGGHLGFSAGKNEYVTAYGALRLRGGLFEGQITQQGNSVNASATMSGALVVEDNGVFASQRVDDAFAVVDAGAPGVKVLRENLPVGITGSSGKLLVTGLNSYQENKISIDPVDLPISADVPNTEMRIVPAERSGVVAAFGVKGSLPSAQVIFIRSDRSFVEPGTHGVVPSTSETFVVGYDGRAFLKNLSAHNGATLNLKDGPCRATFDFVPNISTLVTIGPVVCQ